MNPTVEAAWIAAGVAGLGIAGTATAAIAGFRATKNATSQTIAASIASTRATLAAAREDRFWEKQAAAYEEVIEALQYRQMKRQHELRMYRLDEDSEQQLKDFFASYDPPGWFEAQARLRAYASDEVWAAFEATQRADIEVWGLYRQYKMLAEDNRLAVESGHPGAAADGETMIKARKAVNPAVEEAETREKAVIGLIREELRSRPESAGMVLEPSIDRRRRRGRLPNPAESSVVGVDVTTPINRTIVELHRSRQIDSATRHHAFAPPARWLEPGTAPGHDRAAPADRQSAAAGWRSPGPARSRKGDHCMEACRHRQAPPGSVRAEGPVILLLDETHATAYLLVESPTNFVCCRPRRAGPTWTRRKKARASAPVICGVALRRQTDHRHVRRARGESHP